MCVCVCVSGRWVSVIAVIRKFTAHWNSRTDLIFIERSEQLIVSSTDHVDPGTGEIGTL